MKVMVSKTDIKRTITGTRRQAFPTTERMEKGNDFRTNPIASDTIEPRHRQEKNKHMKTTNLPSAKKGFDEVLKQLLNGTSNTGAPQFVSLRLKRIKRSIRQLTLMLAMLLLSGIQANAAISHVASASATGATITLPSGWQPGDIALVFAFRDGIATAPSLASGFTDINTGSTSGGSQASARLAYRALVAGDGSLTFTFTNATEYEIMVLRGTAISSPVPRSSTDGNRSNTLNYAALSGSTLSSSWIAGFGGSASATDVYSRTVTGMNTESVSTVNTLGMHSMTNTTSFTARNWPSVNSTARWVTIVAEVLVSPCTTPTAYNVSGGGSYCSGGAGVSVGLADSETGVTYQLYRGGTTAVGSAADGTNNAISFGNQTIVGDYTVVATRTSGGCTNDMTGGATIIINPLPTASATKNDITCFGTSTGQIVVTGTNGTAPYTYSIYNGVAHSPYPDYQSGNIFTGLPAGDYQVRVKDSNTCESKNINPIP